MILAVSNDLQLIFHSQGARSRYCGVSAHSHDRSEVGDSTLFGGITADKDRL
jgi:hypothetical protein